MSPKDCRGRGIAKKAKRVMGKYNRARTKGGTCEKERDPESLLTHLRLSYPHPRTLPHCCCCCCCCG